MVLVELVGRQRGRRGRRRARRARPGGGGGAGVRWRARAWSWSSSRAELGRGPGRVAGRAPGRARGPSSASSSWWRAARSPWPDRADATVRREGLGRPAGSGLDLEFTARSSSAAGTRPNVLGPRVEPSRRHGWRARASTARALPCPVLSYRWPTRGGGDTDWTGELGGGCALGEERIRWTRTTGRYRFGPGRSPSSRFPCVEPCAAPTA